MLIESLSYAVSSKTWSGPLPKLDSPKTLVIAFGAASIGDDPAPLQALARAFPRSHLVGCSSAASMRSKEAGIDAVFVKFEHATLATASAAVSTDLAAVGQELVKQLAKPDLRAVLLFADGVETTGGDLVRGLGGFDSSVVVFGGLSGDLAQVRKGWTLSGGLVKPSTVVAVGLYGEHIVVKSSSRTGWTKLGPERTVTKSDGGAIFDLDGKPALAVFDECLAMNGRKRSSSSLPDLPFAVRASARHDRSLIRTVTSIDEKAQSLRVSVGIPQGYLLQPLSGSTEGMVASAVEAAAAVAEASAIVGSTALALAVSHAGRKRLFMDGVEDEAAAVLPSLPRGELATTFLGMYGGGEIGPQEDGHAQLNNHSFSIALVMESPTPIAQRKARTDVDGGAIRAQAPTMKAGPAAHLRSKSPTVDDLFSELELDGKRRAAAAKPPVPNKAPPGPLPPPRAPGTGSSPSSASRPIVHPPDSGRSARHTERPAAPPRKETPQRGLPAQGAARESRLDRGSPSTLAVSRLKYEAGAWSPPQPGVDSARTLVLFFGPPSETEAAKALARTLPGSHILGCATDRAFGSVDAEISALTATFERTDLITAWSDLGGGAQAAASAIAQQLVRPNLRAVLLFSDGNSAEGDVLVKTLRAAVGSAVVMAGGFATGARPWLIADASVRAGVAVAVGFYGDHVTIGHSTQRSFEAFGPEREVTKVNNRTILEIDRKPALSFAMEQMGFSSHENMMRVPLMLYGGQRSAPTGRIPVSVDQAEQSITVDAAVAPGSTLRFTRMDHERLLDEVGSVVGLAKAQNATTEGAAVVLLVSSMVRQRALGARIEEQLTAAADALPSEIVANITGFSSASELGKLGSEPLEVQSGSVSAIVIGESRDSLAAAYHVSKQNPAETPSPAQIARVTSRPARPSITRALLSSTTLGSAAAKVTKSREGDVTVVAFSGRITESFKGDQLGRELSGTVIFDLSKVERVTSFGVREWLQMLAAAQDRVKKLYLSHCAEAVVNQISMIRKFAAGAQVLSFFGPYLCDSCGEQFERLFDVEAEGDALLSHTATEVMCPQCGGRAHFDDDPETYFAFAPGHVGQPVPLAIRAIHDGINSSAPVRPTDAIEKAVEGSLTRVRVTGRAGSIRWQRVFDGAEGSLVVDLGGLSPMDPLDVQAFEQAIATVPNEVDAVRLERCPQVLVEAFSTLGMPKKVSIASTTLVGHCPACNNQRPALLVVDDHAANLNAGRAPTFNCRRCNGVLELVDAQGVLKMLTRQRRRNSLAPSTSTPAPAPAVSISPLPPPASTPIISAAPLAAVEAVQPIAAPPPPRAPIGVILASAALVSVALLGSAAVVILERRTPVAAAPVAPAAASWSPVTNLPPAWVERGFVIDHDAVYIVGRCERAQTPEAALATTRTDAIIHLVKQLQSELVAGQDFLARVKDEDYARNVTAITERFSRHAGTAGQPERGETIVRERDGSVEAFARYRLSRAAYSDIVASYRKGVAFHNVTFGRAFPALDVPSDVDVVVLTSAPKVDGSPRAGDTLRSIAGRPVSFADLSSPADEWFGVPPNGVLPIELDRGGVRLSVKVRRPPVTYAAVAPAARPAVVAHPPTGEPPAPPLATAYREPTPPHATTKDVGLPAMNYRDPPTTLRDTKAAPKKAP